MYVPGIFHGVRLAENEPHADRHECFLLDVFCWGFLYECFSLGVFHHADLHRLLIIPIIGDCEQYSLRSTFAAVFV